MLKVWVNWNSCTGDTHQIQTFCAVMTSGWAQTDMFKQRLLRQCHCCCEFSYTWLNVQPHNGQELMANAPFTTRISFALDSQCQSYHQCLMQTSTTSASWTAWHPWGWNCTDASIMSSLFVAEDLTFQALWLKPERALVHECRLSFYMSQSTQSLIRIWSHDDKPSQHWFQWCPTNKIVYFESADPCGIPTASSSQKPNFKTRDRSCAVGDVEGSDVLPKPVKPGRIHWERDLVMLHGALSPPALNQQSITSPFSVCLTGGQKLGETLCMYITQKSQIFQ